MLSISEWSFRIFYVSLTFLEDFFKRNAHLSNSPPLFFLYITGQVAAETSAGC